MQETIEQTLDSREVAEMIEKEHGKLLRDIRRYEEQFAEAKIGLGDFFRQSEYKDANSQVRPCYRITKKGCEFIAHKLTGVKGTIFTARYINRFHEMREMISEQKQELPWFIREFRGKYIILERDFISLTGVNISKYKAWERDERIIGGLDSNGWGWKCNNEEFRKEYGFDYGSDDCMMYLYPCGALKVLRMISKDKKEHINPDIYEMLQKEIKKVLFAKPGEKRNSMIVKGTEMYRASVAKIPEKKTEPPIQINIIMGDDTRRIQIK